MDYKDLIERAAWTFLQAFLAAAFVDNEISYQAGTIAGLAAVVSLAKNAVWQKAKRR